MGFDVSEVFGRPLGLVRREPQESQLSKAHER